MSTEAGAEFYDYMKMKGRPPSQNEIRRFNQFLNENLQALKEIIVAEDPATAKLYAKLRTLVSENEKESKRVAQLSAIVLFLAHVMRSSDQKFNEQLLQRLQQIL